MENIFKTLFPEKCLFCGNYGYTFCPNCLLKARPVKKSFCIMCQKQSGNGVTHKTCATLSTPASIFCCFEYDELVRECIKKSKYYSKYFKALKDLSIYSAIYVKNLNIQYKGFILVPIPMNPKKQHLRGFNQADLIADQVSKVLNLKVDKSILIRKKLTSSQYEMNRQQRFKNLEDAFITAKDVKGQKILLIDDISTTGSTFLEAAKALSKANSGEVHCFSLAKRL